MRKSLQTPKSGRAKVLFFGRPALRLVLAALIGGFTGKFILSAAQPELRKAGRGIPEHETEPHRSPGRLEMKAKAIESGKEMVRSDFPSSESRAYLSLIRRLPTLNSREFFKLAQKPAGGAPLQKAVLDEWAKRHPKEMFQTLHAAFPSEEDPRREWCKLAVIEWMKQDPDEAIKCLDGIPRRIGQGGPDPHLCAIDAAKESDNFGLALDLESRWPNQVWSGLTGGTFERWYARQPAVAVAKIAKIGHAGLRASYIERIGVVSAGASEEEILGTASTFSTLDRQAFLKGAVGAMARESPEAALSFLSRNFKGANLSDAAKPVILQWATKDPRAAIQWSEQNLRGKSRDKAVSAAIRQTASQDTELATDLVTEMNPGPTRNESASVLLDARMRGKAPGLAEWIESFPDGAAKRSMLDKNWSMFRYNAPGLLPILTASEDPQIASTRRISEFAKNFSATHPEAFATWVRSLPERNRTIAEAAVK